MDDTALDRIARAIMRAAIEADDPQLIWREGSPLIAGRLSTTDLSEVARRIVNKSAKLAYGAGMLHATARLMPELPPDAKEEPPELEPPLVH
jgi:hypothetical protein